MSLDLPEVDIRSVAILWTGEEEPQVIVSGCSIYEAIGLLICGLDALRAESAMDEADDPPDSDG